MRKVAGVVEKCFVSDLLSTAKAARAPPDQAVQAVREKVLGFLFQFRTSALEFHEKAILPPSAIKQRDDPMIINIQIVKEKL